MVREPATKHGVRLSLELTPAVDLVEGDERRLRQVIFNLLSNAVKFTPEGGSVVVASARVDGEVQVSVTDTGPGIALEDQERIFEEFQQTDVGIAAARGHRARARALQAPRRAARRPHLGGERARSRQPLRVHAPDQGGQSQWPVSGSSSSKTTRRT